MTTITLTNTTSVCIIQWNHENNNKFCFFLIFATFNPAIAPVVVVMNEMEIIDQSVYMRKRVESTLQKETQNMKYSLLVVKEIII